MAFSLFPIDASVAMTVTAHWKASQSDHHKTTKVRQNGAEGVALLSHVAMAVLALFLGHLLGTDPILPLILLP